MSALPYAGVLCRFKMFDAYGQLPLRHGKNVDAEASVMTAVLTGVDDAIDAISATKVSISGGAARTPRQACPEFRGEQVHSPMSGYRGGVMPSFQVVITHCMRWTAASDSWIPSPAPRAPPSPPCSLPPSLQESFKTQQDLVDWAISSETAAGFSHWQSKL
jgi:hypothetical protein